MSAFSVGVKSLLVESPLGEVLNVEVYSRLDIFMGRVVFWPLFGEPKYKDRVKICAAQHAQTSVRV